MITLLLRIVFLIVYFSYWAIFDALPQGLDVPLTVKDIDGNVYPIVTIGGQRWMAKNLCVSRYQNGDSIPLLEDNYQWASAMGGGYCLHNCYDSVCGDGRLYNWYAVVDNRGICPPGWRVPSDKDWTALAGYLGGWRVAGSKMKVAGKTPSGGSFWLEKEEAATNESGFSGLPGSNREASGNYSYTDGGSAYWWSTSRPGHYATHWSLRVDNPYLFQDDATVNDGLCVRCVQNR